MMRLQNSQTALVEFVLTCNQYRSFLYLRCTYVPCAVFLSNHVALVECLPALLGIEGGLVEQHAALLTRGHAVAEGAVAAQGEHRGCGLLKL